MGLVERLLAWAGFTGVTSITDARYALPRYLAVQPNLLLDLHILCRSETASGACSGHHAPLGLEGPGRLPILHPGFAQSRPGGRERAPDGTVTLLLTAGRTALPSATSPASGGSTARITGSVTGYGTRTQSSCRNVGIAWKSRSVVSSTRS